LNRAIAFIANLINWIPLLAVWAFRDAKGVWVSILPIALIIGCVSLKIGLDEQGIRISGLLLELLGILVVAKGLSESRKLFGRPSLYQSFVNWVKRYPRFEPRSYTLKAGEGSVRLSGTVSMVFTPGHKEAISIEERMSALEAKHALLTRQLEEYHAHLDKETGKWAYTMKSEEEARFKGDKDNAKQLEAAVVGGINLETMGIVWLACGVTLSSLSAELEYLISKLAGA
jgi:hypothetical protein